MFRRTRATARTRTVPSPVGGINDRDSLVNMKEKDAVLMVNWWPEPSRLVSRKGCITRNTGFSLPVKTIVEYPSSDGVNELFAASGGNIYDITSVGEIGDPVVSGLGDDEHNEIIVSTPGGTFLYLLNGSNAPVLYDGENWTSITDSSTPVSITGVDTTTLKQGCVFKGRVYMVQKNSMSFWYLPPLQIGGAAKEFNLTSIFQRGGYVVGIYTWTLDAGQGSDDHLVILSSNGEVIVYAGTDPDVADSFRMVGLFYIGRPIGKRPCAKFGGDLLILCEQGLYPLSLGLMSSEIDRRATKTDKIQNTLNSTVSSFKDQFGFEVCGYPSKDALIINIPTTYGYAQFVQNTITGAWTRFQGWDARTFKDTSIGLLFGDGDSVKIAWSGESDSNQNIVCEVVSAFNDFKDPVNKKLFTMIKPYFRTNGSPSVLYGINGDYNLEEIEGNMSFTEPDGMFWGSMFWGAMRWGSSFRAFQTWQTVGKMYRAAAVRIKVQNNFSSIEWSATDLVYQRGGIL